MVCDETTKNAGQRNELAQEYWASDYVMGARRWVRLIEPRLYYGRQSNALSDMVGATVR